MFFRQNTIHHFIIFVVENTERETPTTVVSAVSTTVLRAKRLAPRVRSLRLLFGADIQTYFVIYQKKKHAANTRYTILYVRDCGNFAAARWLYTHAVRRCYCYIPRRSRPSGLAPHDSRVFENRELETWKITVQRIQRYEKSRKSECSTRIYVVLRCSRSENEHQKAHSRGAFRTWFMSLKHDKPRIIIVIIIISWPIFCAPFEHALRNDFAPRSRRRSERLFTLRRKVRQNIHTLQNRKAKKKKINDNGAVSRDNRFVIHVWLKLFFRWNVSDVLHFSASMKSDFISSKSIKNIIHASQLCRMFIAESTNEFFFFRMEKKCVLQGVRFAYFEVHVLLVEYSSM